MPSPREDYPSLEIARDATDFINSRFGQRYMERLTSKKSRLLDIITDKTYANEYRASAGSELKVVQEELDYFNTATTIMRSPNLISKLQAKVTQIRKGKTKTT